MPVAVWPSKIDRVSSENELAAAVGTQHRDHRLCQVEGSGAIDVEPLAPALGGQLVELAPRDVGAHGVNERVDAAVAIEGGLHQLARRLALATSATNTVAWPPPSAISVATASSAEPERNAVTSVAPSAANARAAAHDRPNPLTSPEPR